MLVVPGTPSGPTLTVLGSGTLVPDDDHHGAAHLVQAGDARILLDCGPGTLHGMARYRVDWPELTHLAVTHYHNDHVGDLPALMQALRLGVEPSRTRPLTLLGPRGFRDYLARLSAVAGSQVIDPGFPLSVVELGPGEEHRDEEYDVSLSCMPTPHTPESVAYRVAVAEATVGYTGDTGPSDLVSDFLRGCDVLIAECTQEDPPGSRTHLSPRGVAHLARAAAPDLLVVTHVAPPLTPQLAVQAVRERYRGDVVAARDGLIVPLG